MIGILALQGDFAAHGKQLTKLGCPWQLIKKPEQLTAIDGLIIPGGESTALLKLMRPFNFAAALKQFVQQGKGVLGTCTGLILLARDVQPQQESLGLIDITAERNAYGRQIDSFIATAQVNKAVLGVGKLEMVFIRAPKIRGIGTAVEVLASLEGEPTLVRQNTILVASFHPELSEQSPVHEYFVEKVVQCVGKVSSLL